ncbi:hypothetical protein M3201_17815 [Paenibacillus motobuensis]|uniref:DUF6544 family protein n=1 Tax=Paenibacillus TaxID=44249 RepID=UPI00203EAD1C|nr:MULTISPECIES: DUF6544 family protein [Paenibacillus]MCM3041554.1 hypothetical protein [Paenibacillus lutimineralis]MCM3648658.1 hypothetical protein [Paenibacillus motobuensis]
MWVIILILVVIIAGILIFFNIPYSMTRAKFEQTVTDQIRSSQAAGGDTFTLEDIQELPEPVRRYFAYSGYIGTAKMSYMKASFKQVDFIMSPDKPAIKIDYTQYNFVREPVRLAYIDTSMYGIPFEGFDSYIDGRGGMKGVLGKVIPLFNQTGEEMNQACLATFLSESLVVPNVALQDYIAWEPVDDTHAKATITYKGISASGVFTFSEVGEALCFTTEDRAVISTDGTVQRVTWSALFKEYKNIGGIRQPTHLQAVWNYEQGDLIYFDSDHFMITYGME